MTAEARRCGGRASLVNGHRRQCVAANAAADPVGDWAMFVGASQAVGPAGVLVHNSSYCGILGGKKTIPTSLEDAKLLTGRGIHAHHIVPKGAWIWADKHVKGAQAILTDKAVGIDLKYGVENLTWALHQDHSKEYAKAIYEALAPHAGNKTEIIRVLGEIKDILLKGEKFRGLPTPI